MSCTLSIHFWARITADSIRIIDKKIDDGKPSSGKFGIIFGQVGCGNVTLSTHLLALLSSCNVTFGKKLIKIKALSVVKNDWQSVTKP